MGRVASTVPVLPVPIIAWHLEQAGGQIARAELETLFERDIDAFEARGLNICLPQSGALKGMDAALRMLEARGLIAQEDGQVALTGKHGDLARYYARSIAHLTSEAGEAAFESLTT
jgi:glycerol-3-phosphate O-acyltransferase